MDWLSHFYDHVVINVLGVPLLCGFAIFLVLSVVRPVFELGRHAKSAKVSDFCTRGLAWVTKWQERGFWLFMSVMMAVPIGFVTLYKATTAWVFRYVLPAEFEPADFATHDRPRTLRQMWHERHIHLVSMRPPLKLITGVAIAELLAAAALFSLHSFFQHTGEHANTTQVDTYLGNPVFIADFILWLCFGFLVIALSFVLAGALRARPVPRLVVVGLFVLVTHPPFAWSLGLALWLTLVAGVFAAAGILDRSRRRARASGREETGLLSPLGTASAVFVWLLLYYGLLIYLLTGFHLSDFPVHLTRQIFGVLAILIPVLFLAGTDIAELSEEIGHFLAYRVASSSLNPALLITCLPVTLLLAFSIWSLTRGEERWTSVWGGSGLTLAVGILTAGSLFVVVKMVRMTTWRPVHIPFAAMVIAAVFVAGGMRCQDCC